jgi:hypothetical protein
MSDHFPGQSANPLLQGVNQPMVRPIEAKTKPEPVVIENDESHYYCAVPNASMHSHDGTRIPFVNGFYSTRVKSLKEYLDHEIDENDGAGGTLRRASETEVRQIMITRNPQAVMEEDFKKNREPELRAELEAKIRAEMSGVKPTEVSDEEKMAGVDKREEAPVSDSNKSSVKSITPISETRPLSASESFQRAMVGTDKVSSAAADGSAPSNSGSKI